jgi:hypothetical protein
MGNAQAARARSPHATATGFDSIRSLQSPAPCVPCPRIGALEAEPRPRFGVTGWPASIGVPSALLLQLLVFSRGTVAPLRGAYLVKSFKWISLFNYWLEWSRAHV